jgi:pyruvate/2-oxoglutarate dehydrogenase complex dihydrolipoamide dehydrogenase (E3) component
VAIVERNLFGGTCVNTGCTPTKTMVASAAVAHAARRAGDYGVGISGEITVDLAKVKARADAVVGASRSHLGSWIRAMEGCTVIEGQARFETATRLRVGDELIEALETLPKHLVVVGGSYVGLEFAQMFRRFGAQVTVVEKGPRLVGREDEDVSTAIEEILQAEGIALRLNAECIHFAGDPDAPRVGVDCTSGDREVVGSHVLIAVGRRPNTDDLGLEAAGVVTDKRGYITVDDQLRTNVAGIWALGDCNGRGAFTHTAYNDFEIVAANLLDNDPRRVSDRLPVYALYIDPPLGRVGLTEAEAIAAGKTIRIGKRPMTRVSRAIEKGETNGFMKVVVDADTDRIIGAAILGVGGDEAIHGIIDTMYADAPYTTLQRSVAIHPTVSELIPTMLGELGAKVAPA